MHFLMMMLKRNREMSGTLNQTTPKKVSSRINKFLKAMKINSKPVYLPFTFVNDRYLPKHCMSNTECEGKVRDCEIIFGWMIWEDKKNKFIEAEFHSVIKSDGLLIDITPRMDGEEKVLFIQDKNRVPERQDALTWLTWANHKSYQGKIVQALAPITISDVKSNVLQII